MANLFVFRFKNRVWCLLISTFSDAILVLSNPTFFQIKIFFLHRWNLQLELVNAAKYTTLLVSGRELEFALSNQNLVELLESCDSVSLNVFQTDLNVF